MSDDFAKKVAEELKKAGIPVTICEIKLTPKQKSRQKSIERAIHKYIMEIEKAHKRAANSKLIFRVQTKGSVRKTTLPFNLLNGLLRGKIRYTCPVGNIMFYVNMFELAKDSNIYIIFINNAIE